MKKTHTCSSAHASWVLPCTKEKDHWLPPVVGKGGKTREEVHVGSGGGPCLFVCLSMSFKDLIMDLIVY